MFFKCKHRLTQFNISRNVRPSKAFYTSQPDIPVIPTAKWNIWEAFSHTKIPAQILFPGLSPDTRRNRNRTTFKSSFFYIIRSPNNVFREQAKALHTHSASRMTFHVQKRERDSTDGRLNGKKSTDTLTPPPLIRVVFASNTNNIYPHNLPAMPGVQNYHSMRVSVQVREWKGSANVYVCIRSHTSSQALHAGTIQHYVSSA